MKYVFKKRVYILAAFILDLFGAILFFPFKAVKKRAPSSPKKILVTRLDHIGDFVSTTPLFKNLKKDFPDAEITVLINSASKELAYRDPNIDKVITFSPPHLAREGGSGYGEGLRRVIKDVRNIGFDLGIDPRGDILSILIMWLGRVKYRVGYGITGGGFLLDKEARYNKAVPVIDRNLFLLSEIGVSIGDRSAGVYFNDKDAAAAEAIIRDAVSQIIGKTVVLHPFAGAPAREWTMNKFQDLIYRLKEKGISVFLIGTKNDIQPYKDVIDMRGKFTLPQLAYFIRRIGYFIGLNSGPANIAAALGVPTVVIASGTDVIRLWIPDKGNVDFVSKEISCSPCETKICPKEKHLCMDVVSVEDVMSAIDTDKIRRVEV